MATYLKNSNRGFVLITSLILLAVLSLLATMAVRSSLSSERAGANDRDVTIARESAELALRDAERDILGRRFDGVFCASAPATCRNARPAGTRPTDTISEKNFWTYQNIDAISDAADISGGAGSATNTVTAYAVGGVGMYTNQSSVPCGTVTWSAVNWFDGVSRTCAGVTLPTV
jgi:type IV pilus assembly protein PilX